VSIEGILLSLCKEIICLRDERKVSGMRAKYELMFGAYALITKVDDLKLRNWFKCTRRARVWEASLFAKYNEGFALS